MQMPQSAGAVRRALIVLALLVAVLPLSAQTLLLIVQESSGNTPLTPPLAVREGVAESLFSAGIIVLEVPPAYVLPSDLGAFARSAGADLIVDISCAYTETSAGATRSHIAIQTKFTITDAFSGAALVTASDDASNAGREAMVDRIALGKEIGARIAAAAQSAVADWTAGKD